MPLRSIFSCVALTVILRSSILCDGRSDEANKAAVERAAVQGSVHLSRVGSGLKRESAASTRPGSLSFTDDPKGDLNSTKALHSAKLKLLAPSVLCGRDQMTLSVKRRGTHFLIDSGERPLTPLSQMPSTCGFFVTRSRRDVQYAASYKACHVNKEEDEYSLPLRLWGTPMTMSCPEMLPMPTIFCFPNKMVVKIHGVAPQELDIKAFGTWQPLSSACSGCELSVNESSTELTLTAPYNKDLCVEIKDEEYLLSLRWGDFELLASCPPVPSADPTGTAAPDEAPRFQYPQLPIFSQFLEPQSTQTPGLVAPLPFSFVAADFSENQKTPGNPSPALLPRFFLFPRPESPAHPSGDDDAHANRHKLSQTPLSPRYQIPFFQELPVMPGSFLPTTTLPLPATTTETLVTTPIPPGTEKPQLSLQQEFSAMLQNPFQSFPKYPPSLQDPTVHDAESKPQYLPPHAFQFPMLHPPFNHLSQLQNAPVATTEVHPPEKPFYQPHPYIPVYFFPKPAHTPVFLHPPSMIPSNPVPSDQYERQPFYFAIQPFYPFPLDQSQATLTNT
ncbi:uncharacterized protein LOC105927152 [Fundulus heteroclitus]|uniref:uncharacterized protein LOC105927152 n=1 Tax=Fundulus heteroclitus TaxID=8078 RepID=UPI00165A169F|nr:uncharacterized protein LOC105927152 [Fundulus heteroclitus]